MMPKQKIMNKKPHVKSNCMTTLYIALVFQLKKKKKK